MKTIGAIGLACAIAAFGIGGAQAQTSPAPAGAAPADATGAHGGGEAMTIEMKGQDGKDHGTVTMRQTPHGMLLTGDLRDLPEGQLSFHVHEKGLCEGNFDSAGGHFNPDGKEHGFLAENGFHAGDMPNIWSIGGVAKFQTLNGQVGEGAATLNDADGSALMVHAGTDDHHSQPSGDAGGRIACGVIYRAP